MQTPLHSPVTVTAARARDQAGASPAFHSDLGEWRVLLRCTCPRESPLNPSETPQPFMQTKGEAAGLTFKSTSRNWPVTRGRLDTVYWTLPSNPSGTSAGERKQLSGSPVARGNVPCPALQGDSEQPLGPRRGWLTAPIAAT